MSASQKNENIANAKGFLECGKEKLSRAAEAYAIFLLVIRSGLCHM